MGLSLDLNSNQNNRTLYLTGSGNIYKSTNDGANWSLQKTGGFRFTAVDSFNSNLVYAGGEDGFYKSTNAGSSWTIVSHVDLQSNNGSSFWDRDYQGIWDVKTDPNNANYVYVTVFGIGKGLYKSINAGVTFQKIITDDFMRNVAITPQNSEVLYATSSSAFNAGGYDENSNGVYYSENGGALWTIQNEGMAYPFASTVEVDNLENATVFVGSQGTGFQKSAVFATLATQDTTLDNLVTVYPNPFDDKITITTSIKDFNIFIYSHLGQKIKGFNRIENTFNLSTLNSGLYYLEIEDIISKRKIYKKVVKQ
jgi:hypothetical protein